MATSVLVCVFWLYYRICNIDGKGRPIKSLPCCVYLELVVGAIVTLKVGVNKVKQFLLGLPN
jgi:predicted transcriptional regulator